ncbi:MAG: hypothetical protein RLZZ440_1392, partial [Planctomycetota bacterium]
MSQPAGPAAADPGDPMATDNREFIDEFLVESTENLDQLDRD